MCLTSGPLNIIPNRDKKLTITQFLSDILIKLPTICGKPLQISEHTPFNTVSTNFSSNILPKDKDIDVSFMEKNNTTSQLEFSAGYANELHKMKNISATSLETQLAKIHQIHNIPFHENLRVNSSRSTREFQDGIKFRIQCLNTVQNVRGDYVKNSTNDNFTVSNEGSISNYFKIQKPHPLVNEKLDEKQKNLTLKDKLEKATCTKNNKESVKKMDQSITVETMAKNNQLDQLRICDLSEWLQQHSVPHNSKGKKTELISKVLSHIRNTQMLHQFRI
ncbi:uncharacterized protein LOC143424046 [Xylocopa sonorina]|uniref:uncharacterized protein LOC143424046 n=1 Tax=Xylocopa sonorina TaxID=1818115 RepID=UPI00403AA72F